MDKAVSLDGQIIHGFDRFGDWRLRTIDGWTDAPDLKTNSEERPLADGDYEGDDHYKSRLVTGAGRLIAADPPSAFLARERLTSLLETPGVFSTSQLNISRWGIARRGRIKPGAISGRYLPFQIELRFIDPYKYGDKREATGVIGTPLSVFHRGTKRAWPIITVTGSMPGGYSLVLGGRRLEVTRPITAGQTHTIDTRTGILRANGVVTIGDLAATDLFTVKSGPAQTVTSAPRTSGAGTVSLALLDTYI